MGWFTTKENETLRDKAHRKVLRAAICSHCRRPIKGTYGTGSGFYHPGCAKKAAARW